MRILTPVLLSSLLLFPACGDKAAAGANPTDANKGAVDSNKDLLAKQTPAFDSVKSSVTTLNTTLAGITDGATADKAKGTLEGLVTTLKTQMANLATTGKLADPLATEKAGLVKTANDHITKLLGNADVKAKIGTVLGELQGLLK